MYNNSIHLLFKCAGIVDIQTDLQLSTNFDVNIKIICQVDKGCHTKIVTPCKSVFL